MEVDRLFDKNKVELQGILVSYKVYKRHNTIDMIIEVMRKSNKKSDKIILHMKNNEDAKKIVESCMNKFVHITGKLNAYKLPEASVKKLGVKTLMKVDVDEIKQADTERYINSVMYCGALKYIYKPIKRGSETVTSTIISSDTESNKVNNRIPVSFWNEDAERISKAGKESKVSIKGIIKERVYIDRDTKKECTIYEVSVLKVFRVERKKNGGNKK